MHGQLPALNNGTAQPTTPQTSSAHAHGAPHRGTLPFFLCQPSAHRQIFKKFKKINLIFFAPSTTAHVHRCLPHTQVRHKLVQHTLAQQSAQRAHLQPGRLVHANRAHSITRRTTVARHPSVRTTTRRTTVPETDTQKGPRPFVSAFARPRLATPTPKKHVGLAHTCGRSPPCPSYRRRAAAIRTVRTLPR